MGRSKAPAANIVVVRHAGGMFESFDLSDPDRATALEELKSAELVVEVDPSSGEPLE